MGLTRPRAHQLQDSDFKASCRAITTTNITLSGGAPATVDGVSLSAQDRVLVTGQSTGSENGLYRVTTVGTGSDGTWVRSADADATGDITAGMTVMVTEGSTYADTSWKLTTNDPITVGTTALTFEQASAYGFGTVTVDGTSLVADTVGDTLTVSEGTNISLTSDAGTDTFTIAVADAPTFTGNVTGGNLITAGLASVTGNITGGNINTAGLASVTGNITGGNLITGGLASVTGNVSGGNITTAGSLSTGLVLGNLIPSANVTYNLGNATNRWNEIFLAAGTINLGNITIKDDGGTMGVFASDGTTPVALGNTASVTASGNITGGNVISSGAIHTGDIGVVRFFDSDSSHYVEFRSQSTVSANLQFKWPAQDGTSGQVLQTDGAGTLSFATASGGGGASGFQSSTITTHPAAGGNEDLATGPSDDTVETPFESGAQDAFGVSLGTVYDQMEPIGSTTTIDLGDSEAHVGA